MATRRPAATNGTSVEISSHLMAGTRGAKPAPAHTKATTLPMTSDRATLTWRLRTNRRDDRCAESKCGSLLIIGNVMPNDGKSFGKEPFVYSTVVFRDPDGIQLELFALG